MTFPLTPTVIVLGLSPADSDACTGTPLPINFSNLGCRPFLPRTLTQLRRIDLDHRSRAQTSRFPLARSNQDSTSSANNGLTACRRRERLSRTFHRSSTKPHANVTITINRTVSMFMYAPP
jgi:hypothetical protein